MTDKESTQLFEELVSIKWPDDCNVDIGRVMAERRKSVPCDSVTLVEREQPSNYYDQERIVTIDAIGPLGRFKDAIFHHAASASDRIRREVSKLSMLCKGIEEEPLRWDLAAIKQINASRFSDERRKVSIGIIAAMGEVNIENPVWGVSTCKGKTALFIHRPGKCLSVSIDNKEVSVIASNSREPGVRVKSGTHACAARKGMLWLSDRACVEGI